MIKTQSHRLRINAEHSMLLKQYQAEAAVCWNDIMATARCYYQATRKWIGKTELQK